MRVYAYLRASTKEQNVNRAEKELVSFCKKHGFKVSAWFYENESGAKLTRPELFKLIEIADHGDILLVEQVDRISRLNESDWKILRSKIIDKGIKIVSLDLPTSHSFLSIDDKFTERVFEAMNTMMLDFLAAFARKDYLDRRRRQMEGIERAKKLNKYNGRAPDFKQRANIAAHLKDGRTYSEIVNLLGCSRATIASVKKQCNLRAFDND